MKYSNMSKKMNKKTNIINRLKNNIEFQEKIKDATLRIRLANEVNITRDVMGISQPKLAELAKTTQAIISRVENYEVNIGLDLLGRIAEALNFSEKNWSNVFGFQIGSNNQSVGFSLPTSWLSIEQKNHSVDNAETLAQIETMHEPLIKYEILNR